MDMIHDLVRRFNRGPGDIVGLEVSSAKVKAVRVRRVKQSVHLLAADFLPGVDPDSPNPLVVPKQLRAPYAALAVSGSRAVVKLLNMPGRFGEKDEYSLPANLGVSGEDNHRIAYKVLGEGHGRNETRVLAVALPESDAQSALKLLPHGRPAPYALELSGVTALEAFTCSLGDSLVDKTVGLINGCESVCTFAIFHKSVPVLVRRFDFGTQTITAQIAEKFGVDLNTAQGFLSDESFDIASILQRGLEVYFKQIVISREFVERRENCNLSEILISGDLITVRGFNELVQHFLGAEARAWNPFSGLVTAPRALPDALRGQEARFAGACGAALGVVMESM